VASNQWRKQRMAESSENIVSLLKMNIGCVSENIRRVAAIAFNEKYQ